MDRPLPATPTSPERRAAPLPTLRVSPRTVSEANHDPAAAADGGDTAAWTDAVRSSRSSPALPLFSALADAEERGSPASAQSAPSQRRHASALSADSASSHTSSHASSSDHARLHVRARGSLDAARLAPAGGAPSTRSLRGRAGSGIARSASAECVRACAARSPGGTTSPGAQVLLDDLLITHSLLESQQHAPVPLEEVAQMQRALTGMERRLEMLRERTALEQRMRKATALLHDSRTISWDDGRVSPGIGTSRSVRTLLSMGTPRLHATDVDLTNALQRTDDVMRQQIDVLQHAHKMLRRLFGHHTAVLGRRLRMLDRGVGGAGVGGGSAPATQDVQRALSAAIAASREHALRADRLESELSMLRGKEGEGGAKGMGKKAGRTPVEKREASGEEKGVPGEGTGKPGKVPGVEAPRQEALPKDAPARAPETIPEITRGARPRLHLRPELGRLHTRLEAADPMLPSGGSAPGTTPSSFFSAGDSYSVFSLRYGSPPDSLAAVSRTRTAASSPRSAAAGETANDVVVTSRDARSTDGALWGAASPQRTNVAVFPEDVFRGGPHVAPRGEEVSPVVDDAIRDDVSPGAHTAAADRGALREPGAHPADRPPLRNAASSMPPPSAPPPHAQPSLADLRTLLDPMLAAAPLDRNAPLANQLAQFSAYHQDMRAQLEEHAGASDAVRAVLAEERERADRLANTAEAHVADADAAQREAAAARHELAIVQQYRAEMDGVATGRAVELRERDGVVDALRDEVARLADAAAIRGEQGDAAARGEEAARLSDAASLPERAADESALGQEVTRLTGELAEQKLFGEASAHEREASERSLRSEVARLTGEREAESSALREEIARLADAAAGHERETEAAARAEATTRGTGAEVTRDWKAEVSELTEEMTRLTGALTDQSQLGAASARAWEAETAALREENARLGDTVAQLTRLGEAAAREREAAESRLQGTVATLTDGLAKQKRLADEFTRERDAAERGLKETVAALTNTLAEQKHRAEASARERDAHETTLKETVARLTESLAREQAEAPRVRAEMERMQAEHSDALEQQPKSHAHAFTASRTAVGADDEATAAPTDAKRVQNHAADAREPAAGRTDRAATRLETRIHYLDMQLDTQRRATEQSRRAYEELRLQFETEQNRTAAQLAAVRRWGDDSTRLRDRLEQQDRFCARVLGKIDGREEMDGLLDQIKWGPMGRARETPIERTHAAAEELERLVSQLEEHVSDMAEGLARADARSFGGNVITQLEERIEHLDAQLHERDELAALAVGGAAGSAAGAPMLVERVQALEGQMAVCMYSLVLLSALLPERDALAHSMSLSLPALHALFVGPPVPAASAASAALDTIDVQHPDALQAALAHTLPMSSARVSSAAFAQRVEVVLTSLPGDMGPAVLALLADISSRLLVTLDTSQMMAERAVALEESFQRYIDETEVSGGTISAGWAAADDR
ncbi:hypothetical protein MSPP1_003012 [Malassezia sp. CBS 17886]|nr:hypothetical protein MSPP1_003012 [Malassezia sp. CBS 17886]